MVFDVKKMVDMDLTEEALLATQTYFFEYVLKNLLIPGQVENWVALIDAGYVSVFSLVGSTKECFKFLSSTFRCRMFAAYVVQCPNSIYWAWSIAKKFLQEETINKFNFFD